MSSSVTSGSSLATRAMAPSWSMPAGSPLASRSIRPSGGSGVRASIPARRSARLFTQAPWPSQFGRYTGRSGTTASSGCRAGMPPGKAASSQPPPVIHSSSGCSRA